MYELVVHSVIQRFSQRSTPADLDLHHPRAKTNPSLRALLTTRNQARVRMRAGAVYVRFGG